MVGTKWRSVRTFDPWVYGDTCTIVHVSGNGLYACVFDRNIGGHRLGTSGAPRCGTGRGWWIAQGEFEQFFAPLESNEEVDIKYSFDSFLDGTLRG